MTRLEEVEATLSTWNGLEAGIQLRTRRELCRTLAAEVDELTADRDSECRWACQYKDERDSERRRACQYKTERDELQRRLNDVVGECCGTRDVCARTITTIAEGRNND